jgi:hypothetical protein
MLVILDSLLLDDLGLKCKTLGITVLAWGQLVLGWRIVVVVHINHLRELPILDELIT